MSVLLMARKEGLTILAVTCALMVGWLRSLIVTDEYVTSFVAASPKYTETHFFRSKDHYLSFLRRYVSSGTVTEKPAWSVHYAALTVPAAAVSACLIIRPLRKPMPVADWIVTTIIGIVLFAIIFL